MKAERILVRGVNWLGDAVMSTPALQRLRQAHPGARIALLTHEKLADLWTGHPDLDEVLTFSAEDSVWRVGRRLRHGMFDTGIAFPNSPRSALELRLAGISRRIGWARPWRNWLLTEAIAPPAHEVKMRKRSVGEIRELITGARPSDPPPPPEAHHIHQYLRLAAAAGASPIAVAPRLVVSAGELEQARLEFGFHARDLWLGLNAGAEYGPAKRWPEERFVEAAVALHRQTGCRWVLFGGRGDIDVARRIARAAEPLMAPGSIRNLAGRTRLGELRVLLKVCRVVLTNDSGPMHLAAAVGTPVVVPFGSTSPELTGPGLPGGGRHCALKSGAACSPCFLRECPVDFRCMKGIAAERVVEAVRECLDARD